MRFSDFLAVTCSAVALAPSLALGHDFWLEAQTDVLVLRYGHRGGEPLDLDAGKVQTILCRKAAADPADLRGSAKVAPRELRVAARCDAASAYLDGGFWSLTPDGEKNLPRNKVPDAVRSWHSRQWAKWVETGTLGAATPLGDDLEIVPVTDLSKVHQGDKATFRVLWRGKPVEGAVLAIDHRPLGETDAAGECRVKIRAEAVESVSVTLKRPLGAPGADTMVAEASLTFRVAK